MSTQQQVLSYLRLQVHSQLADLSDCYTEGYEGAQANLTEEENPYEVDTNEHQNWTEGWWAGFYEEEPLFQENKIVAKLPSIAPLEAANKSIWSTEIAKSWTGRVIQATGIILASIAILELADLAA